jgi:hypothetical protein
MTRMACLGQHTITKNDWDINGLLAFFMMPQVARLEEEAQTDPIADIAPAARRLHYVLSPCIAHTHTPPPIPVPMIQYIGKVVTQDSLPKPTLSHKNTT